MGWWGSKPLEKALVSNPCGCELEYKASLEADERGKKIMLNDAKIYQKEWQCRRKGYSGPLSESAKKTLKVINNLIEDEISCCPGQCVRESEAHEVLDCIKWFDKGQLQLRNPYPSASLVEAIGIVKDAFSARESAEIELLKKEKDG